MTITGMFLIAAALLAGIAALVYNHRLVVARRDREYSRINTHQSSSSTSAQHEKNRTKTESRIEIRLLSAGVTAAPARIIFTFVVLTSAAGFMGFSLSGNPLAFMGALALAFGIFILWLRRRTAQRTRAFGRQLAAALPMISENLRGGLTTQSAFATVAEYLNEPLHTELTRVVRDVTTANMALPTALSRLAQRMKNADVELLATTIAIQRSGGGNLADILDSIAATITKRLEMRGHIDAITSSARLSALVVGAMPFVLLALLSLGSPNYMADFWASSLWLPALGIVTALDATGFSIIHHLYTLEIG